MIAAEAIPYESISLVGALTAAVIALFTMLRSFLKKRDDDRNEIVAVYKAWKDSKEHDAKSFAELAATSKQKIEDNNELLARLDDYIQEAKRERSGR